MDRLIFRTTLYFFLLHGSMVFSQSSTHIVNYVNREYGGGNQNWDISLDNSGNVFVANNNGLLILDGASWHLHQLPGKTSIRSVTYDAGKVYTGSFEELGYWKLNDKTDWEYQSLNPLLNGISLNNQEIWKIVKHKGKIYFQSFGIILMYDYEKIHSLSLPGSVLLLLQAGEHLYIQQITGGLYEVIDDKLVFVPGSDIFSSTEIKAIIPLNDKEILIGTSSNGIFIFNGESFRKWETEYSKELVINKINNGIRSGDHFIFGTILKGVYVVDKDGRPVSHLYTGTLLQNNTVLSLEGDCDGNIWVGMDNGIDYVSFNSPLDKYVDNELNSGSAYTGCLFDNELFIGTNQGVFYYNHDKDNKFTGRQFIDNSQGQVWFLKNIDGKLYCGLNDGTYVIVNHRLRKVSNISGGYNLKKVLFREKEMLIQSTYSLIVAYKKEEEIWVQDKTLHGFLAPARYLETDFLGNIWIGHSVNGIYMIQPSGELDSARHVKKIGLQDGLTEKANIVVKIDNRIIIPTGRLLYRWDDINNRIVPYSVLNSQLEHFESASSVIPVSKNRYWFIKKNEIGMFEINYGNAKLLYRIIPEMYDLNLIEGAENIVSLNDSLNLICLDNGFAVLNTGSLYNKKDFSKFPVLRDIHFFKSPDKVRKVNSSNLFKVQVAHNYNNFNITYKSGETVGSRTYYQYMLKGIDNDWSDWTIKSEVEYYRLPQGNYTFQVRTLSNRGIITEPAVFSFRIKPPFFFSVYAYISYAVIIICLIFLLRAYYRRRMRKHKRDLLRISQEKIEQQRASAEQEIVKLTNEKLQAEISFKNSQLANSTMSIIKKNELLIEINNELDRFKEDLGYRIPNKYYDRVKKLINQNFESEHDWEMFEKLFDQAHHNFFKRLKTAYPELTPADLRLCAYLRLNLSSKEIAPLINITVRGLEERRFRLRKRLNLSSEQNLTEYIMSF